MSYPTIFVPIGIAKTIFFDFKTSTLLNLPIPPFNIHHYPSEIFYLPYYHLQPLNPPVLSQFSVLSPLNILRVTHTFCRLPRTNFLILLYFSPLLILLSHHLNISTILFDVIKLFGRDHDWPSSVLYTQALPPYSNPLFISLYSSKRYPLQILHVITYLHTLSFPTERIYHNLRIHLRISRLATLLHQHYVFYSPILTLTIPLSSIETLSSPTTSFISSDSYSFSDPTPSALKRHFSSPQNLYIDDNLLVGNYIINVQLINGSIIYYKMKAPSTIYI